MRAVAAHLSSPMSHELITAYQSGFSSTLNHLMLISTFVALVGAVMGFFLVRQKDFVVPAGGGAPAAAARRCLSPSLSKGASCGSSRSPNRTSPRW